ncbi:MAG: hypothetical protein Q9184_005238 [Pyrenodesmia sp. 2 TL-2023]
MGKMKAGGSKTTAVDPNIRFPLGDKLQPWVENIEDENMEDEKHAGREEDEQETNGHAQPHAISTMNPYHHDHHCPKRDTLGEALVREGIINTEKPTIPEIHKHSIDSDSTA